MKIMNEKPKATLPGGKSRTRALSRSGALMPTLHGVREVFDQWFMANYSILKECISLSGYFDEDAFHEAYLVIATDKNIVVNAKDFRKMFMSTYRAASRHTLNESFIVCHPDDLFFSLLPETGEAENPPKDYDSLAKEIVNFIRSTFPVIQQSVLQMRVDGYSLRDTADTLNIPERQVKDDINAVVCRTREQFAYAM